ncbi:tape measure protein [Spirosoma harenae]
MSSLRAMENRIIGLSGTAIRETKLIDDSFRRLGQLAVGAFAFSGLSDLPQQILKVRSEFQQLEISMTTMLKNKALANDLLRQVVQYAGETPFSVKETATGAKQLLAYGFAAKDLIPILKTLGNVSAVLNLPLERLIYLYGTTKTQGRLFASDLNQFVSSGIPLISELAKQFSVSEESVRKLVEEGRVGFPQVKKALKSLTTGSGLFAGTLDAQSKSLNALKERLGDAYEKMLNDIGKKNEGLAADVFSVATEVVEHYQEVVDTLKVLAGAYGGAKAATVLYGIAQKSNFAITAAQAIAQAQAANATGFLTISQTKAAASTALLTRAQAALNGVMRINPIVLIGTAIAALVTSYLVFKDEVEEVKTAQELLAGIAKTTSDRFATQKAEVVSLISTLKNQNIAESTRLRAYNQLNEISPKIINGLSFQQAKTADLTATLNEYLASLKQKIKLEAGQEAFGGAFKQELEAGEKATQIQKELNELLAQAGKVKPGQGSSAITVALSQKIASKRVELSKAIKAEADARKTTEAVERSIGEGLAEGSKQALEAAIAQDEARLRQLKDTDEAYKIVEDDLIKHKAELAKLNSAPAQGPTFLERLEKADDAASLRLTKNYAKTENDLKALQKAVQEKIGSSALGSQTKAQLEKLDAEINYALGKRTQAQKAAEKVGPYGSISYWENVVKLAEEALSKTPKTDVAAIEKQKATILNAQTQLEEVRKATATRSFEEELDEKQRLYALYTKFIENYGKTSADNQFADLRKNGDSYLDYLNAQIAKLETKQKAGTLSDTEAKNLGGLITRRDDFTQKKSAIDVFTQGLQKAQVESKSLADYLSVLKARQAELNNVVSPLSADYTKKKEAVAQDIVNVERQLKDQATQFLINSASSGEQELAIRRKYNDLRLGLDKLYNGKRTEAYDTALADINDKEQQEFEDFKQRKFEETQAYRNTQKVILEEGEKANQIAIQRQREAVAVAETTAGKTSQAYLKALKQLQDLEKQAADKGKSGLQAFVNKYTGIVLQFGQALSQVGGEAGVVGDILVSFASNVDLINQAFDKSTSKANLYGIAIQGLVSIYNSVSKAAEQRKQKEEEYYRSMINSQQQYNLLLNEQIGLRTKSKENVFVKDYLGELKDNYEKFDKAQARYQDNLRKLAAGRAKTGLQTVDDKGSGLNIIGSGAAAGAAIGTLIAPVIGTAVGAAIGGIVGGIATLFGGSKKKADEFGSLLATYPDIIKKSKDGVDELNTALAQTLIDQGLVDDSTRDLLQSTIEWQKQMEEARQAIKDMVATLAGSLGDKLRDSLVGAFEDGTDAAQAFSSSVSAILEDMVTKILFSKAFKSLFDTLEADLTNSLNVAGGGDGNVLDDFQRFTQNSQGAMAEYNKWLQQFKDAASQSGFDVLKSSKLNPAASLSTQGGRAYQTLSETTGSALMGQFNAMRIQQADINAGIRNSNVFLSNIDRNTAMIKQTNELLSNMDRRLRNLEDFPATLRALGVF